MQAKLITRLLIVIIVTAAVGAFLYLPQVKDSTGWYNSAEFSIAAATLDVPHAPGYPLFTRLGNLALRYLPGSTPAARINLLTSLIAILGGSLLSVLLLLHGLSLPAALAGGIFLLCGVTYRDQAILAEVYALEICFIAAGLLCGLMLEKGHTGAASGFACGLAGTLGVGHRPTFGLFALTLLLFIREAGQRQVKMPSGRFWAAMGFGVLIGFLPSVDLYLRLQNPARVLLDPLTGQGIDGFLQVFTGTVYSGGFMVFHPLELWQRLLEFLRLCIFENGIWLLIGPGTLLALRPRTVGALPAALTAILAINLAFVINYNAFEAHTMLLPSFMALAGLAAIALDLIRSDKIKTLACVALMSTAVFSLSLHPAENDDPEIYMRKILSGLPAKAMVLMSNDAEFRPYWYLRLFKKFRQDLAVQLVDKFAAGELQALKPAAEAGMLYGSLVYPHDSFYQLTASYSIEPDAYLHRVIAKNNWEPLDTSHIPQLDSAISLNPANLPAASEASATATGQTRILTPGDSIAYSYSFAGLSGYLDSLAVVTTILDESGAPLSRNSLLLGHDIHIAGDYVCRHATPEQGRFTFNRSLVIPVDLAPGSYRVMLQAFLTREGEKQPWHDAVPEGVTLFNHDGFNEIFRLKYGLSGRLLLPKMPAAELFGSLWKQPVMPAAIEVASFTILPAPQH